jgi:DNA-directed RNA polymerase subunit RPC12/RpoP
MESYVNCPECGELVSVVLKPNESEGVKFAKGLSEAWGLDIGKSSRFVSDDVKCKCGRQIVVSMTVTAMQRINRRLK